MERIEARVKQLSQRSEIESSGNTTSGLIVGGMLERADPKIREINAEHRAWRDAKRHDSGFNVDRGNHADKQSLDDAWSVVTNARSDSC